jgi:hypothetical protein
VACRPTGIGRHQRWLGHSVEHGEDNSRSLQPLRALLNFLQAEIVKHFLERWEGRRVCEDDAKVIEVPIQPTENVHDEDTVGGHQLRGQ